VALVSLGDGDAGSGGETSDTPGTWNLACCCLFGDRHAVLLSRVGDWDGGREAGRQVDRASKGGWVGKWEDGGECVGLWGVGG
jgi:hypothetical protein